ncbi:AAA family ATPase [Salinibacter ruber]|uniref:MoxR-like ATPase n=1 Tax=Salinibacter ruber TaxID=146919 RepID=A0AAW5P778_9BACT|nr:AAA family ATPase [Salinibacter ruber]MCS4157627.1 MoxR-like ATPase [Salinibacter ruber]
MSSSASRNLLSNIDVYGWQEVEDLVLAALVLNANMLIIGEKGQGKTWLATRIMQAVDLVLRDEGSGTFPVAQLDGHAANPQDLVGYPFPPDDEQVRKAIENGESPEMLIALSPNTIAGCKGVVIDEVTRIPPNMQNRYLGMLEEGVVEGRELAVEQIIGAANPVSYSGTEVMDEAFADRWRVRVQAPSFLDMPKAERKKAVKAQATDLNDSEPDLGAAKDLVSFVREAGRAYTQTKQNNLPKVSDYVVNAVSLIDKGLNGEIHQADISVDIDPNRTTSDIGSRRAGIIMDNMFALHAVRTVRGETDTLAKCASEALSSSLVHDLHADDPVPTRLLEGAHDLHKGVLKSEQARVRSLVEGLEDPVERVAKAFQLRLPQEDVSAYIHEAHSELSNDEIKRKSFSWVLFNKLQHGDDELASMVTDSKLDLLVSDVRDLISVAETMEFTDRAVHPDHEAIGAIGDFIGAVDRLRQTAEGRLTLAIAEHARRETDSDSANVMSGATVAARKYTGLNSSVETAENNVEEMIDVFTDLSRDSRALN